MNLGNFYSKLLNSVTFKTCELYDFCTVISPFCRAFMPKITVMIYTTLKDRLGVSKAELEGGTVHELLLKLAVSGKMNVSEILFEDDGSVRNHFVLTLNSGIVDNRKTGKAKVRAGDILHVFPPISGG